MTIYIHATALRLKADKSVDICYCLLLLINFQYRLLRLEIKIFTTMSYISMVMLYIFLLNINKYFCLCKVRYLHHRWLGESGKTNLKNNPFWRTVRFWEPGYCTLGTFRNITRIVSGEKARGRADCWMPMLKRGRKWSALFFNDKIYQVELQSF